MIRDYLIKRMNRANKKVINIANRLPSRLDLLDKDQVDMVEDIEFILLQAYGQIENKIAEYTLKSA